MIGGRALRIGLVLVASLAGGCGLLSRPDPIGFRTYTLEGCGIDEAVSIVRDVTKTYALEHFGGVGISWDESLRNLTLDPVYEGQRRLKLYVHVEPSGEDVNVEMFALVETLAGGGTKGVGWIDPKQDVPLEQALFQAYVAELLARRDRQP